MPFSEYLVEYLPKLLVGAWTTLAVFVCSALLATLLSLVFGVMRLSRHRVIDLLALVYIEFFRGTSLLVQLFWIYYVLPLFGLTLSAFVAGVMGLGLNFGAYGAEILRGAIQSVPRGQTEAAVALNMSPALRLRRITIPQAIPILLPPASNLLIELLKATALVAFISVVELMFVAKQINATTWLSVQTFGVALLLYYAMARLIVIPLLRWLERHVARSMGRA